MPASHAASTWTVSSNGDDQRCELVVARTWDPSFDVPLISPDAEFRLVLLTESQSRTPSPLTNPRVLCIASDGAVYSGATTIANGHGVRETQTPYGATIEVDHISLPIEKVQQFLSNGSEYLTTYGYVEDAGLPAGQDELEVDRRSLLAQLEPAYLLDHPEVWASVVASFGWFRARYLALYWQFHESYQGEVLQAAALLEQARRKAEALQRLNTLTQLGPAAGPAALDAWTAGVERNTRCFFDEGMPERDPVPYCPQCDLRMGAPSPRAAAQATVAGLDDALGTQFRRLSSQTVHRILSATAGPRIERFLDVLQASDASSLVQVLDDDVTLFLQSLLAEELAAPTETTILSELREQYEVVEESEVAAAVATFERLLREAVERARREHPEQSPRLRLE